MKIEYRELLPHESRHYRMIRLESLKVFPESFGANYEESLKIEKFRLQNDIENPVQERFVFGAFDNAELVGICVFVKEEIARGNIYQMYVKQSYQGKNIGFGLIQSVINEAENRFNNIEFFLEVKANNVVAYHLYKKIGFEEVEADIDAKEKSTNKVMKYFKK
ncbi:GNAT family N-acetyltransferase [Chryseobacterium sp. G0201]|uniref:GNAT family N-acetyltransferase n=1 Tax=Chryseobacterium sp. G0201 TaxID=2487065 RepID=UPI000F4F9C84|nr:GNAT family N-acetyltransferase [Chryseobacterium sp. G0201]AZA54100.1 GNAT family N-acetyltransferase [Chryseobacterium sp. G0201]